MSASIIGADKFKQGREQNTVVRTSGRSCPQGVGERERERLRIVRKEGKYRSTSMVGTRKIEGPFSSAKVGC